MKENTKNVLYTIMTILILCLLLLAYFYPRKVEGIQEEAIPIRDEENMIGLDYVITIGEEMKKNQIRISSHILDSITHYTDVSQIDSFLIRVKIQNNSSFSYLLKDISIRNSMDSSFREDLDYHMGEENNLIIFQLDSLFFENYQPFYQIDIELEK